MIFLLALLPATMLTVVGYIVLYISGRSEGSFRAFGKYLGFWAFTLAGLVILGALFAAHHHHHMGDWRAMHDRMQGPWRDPASGELPPGPPAAAAPPAAPNAPPTR